MTEVEQCLILHNWSLFFVAGLSKLKENLGFNKVQGWEGIYLCTVSNFPAKQTSFFAQPERHLYMSQLPGADIDVRSKKYKAGVLLGVTAMCKENVWLLFPHLFSLSLSLSLSTHTLTMHESSGLHS